jgi:hypothetical protein
MSIPFPFNAQNVKPADADYTPTGWPVGEFPAVIIGHDVKPTKENTGGYVEFTIQGIDQSPVAGTTAKIFLNLFNNSQKAVEIAQQQLSAICHCVGYFQFNTTDDFVNLYNKPFTAKFGRQKEKTQYTEYKGAKPYAAFNPATLEDASQAPQQPAQAPQHHPQQPATNTGWNSAPAQPAQPAQAPQWGQQPTQPAQPAQPPAAQPNGGTSWAPAQPPANTGGGWQPGGAAPASAPSWAGKR